MENEIANVNDLYLLSNRTFNTLEGELTNLEFKIMTLMMIKTQKELLKNYKSLKETPIEKIPYTIPCSFSVAELRQFRDRKQLGR